MSVQKKPTQTDRFHDWLIERGAQGVHTFEMRREFMGNPSARMSDLKKRGVSVVAGPRERLHGAAFGVRYWLAEHAPTSAAEGQVAA